MALPDLGVQGRVGENSKEARVAIRLRAKYKALHAGTGLISQGKRLNRSYLTDETLRNGQQLIKNALLPYWFENQLPATFAFRPRQIFRICEVVLKDSA